tara:strand:- start:10183 stop:10812 length:630 start_codon:yes stop_codon:yes gene_type:complete
MTKQKQVIFIGSGGHALPLIEAAKLLNLSIKGFITNSETSPYSDIEILGSNDVASKFSPKEYDLVLAIGSVDQNSKRESIAQFFYKLGFTFRSIIDPRAIVSNNAELKEGVQVMAGAYIGPGCIVGKNSIINTRSIVEHQSQIEDYSHIAPGAIICGNARIGRNVFVGAGSTVIQGLKIDSDVLVAAGSVVVNDLKAGLQVKGIPARTY